MACNGDHLVGLKTPEMDDDYGSDVLVSAEEIDPENGCYSPSIVDFEFDYCPNCGEKLT